MGWFSGRRPALEPAAPAGHHSESLRALLSSLRSDSRRSVLDLGAPIASNIKLLSALSCRVRIADLQRSLSAESLESRRPEGMAALFERLLPLEPDERFDALLAWDVFDYLRPDQVTSLLARLTPACRPGALALVLVSTRSQIPARPLRYRIVANQTLAYDGPLQPVRTCPRYSQGDLSRMAPGFSVQRSLLLRNGLQEYLLVNDAGQAAARSREAISSATAGRAWFRQRG